MGGFLLRRLGAALVVLLLASMLVFLGVRALPGDPAIALGGENRDPAVMEAVRHHYGLDKPLPVQYAKWRALPGTPGSALAGENRAPGVMEPAPHHYGLNKPLPVQYAKWLGLAVKGDL